MKKIVSYFPTHFLVCTIMGICLQFYLKSWLFGFEKLVIITFLIFSLFFFFYILNKKFFYTIISWFLCILIGISSVYITNNKNYKNHYTKVKKEGSFAILKINTVLKPTNYYTKYEASILQIDSIKTKGNILLSISKDTNNKTLQTGQKLLVKPSFKEISPRLNPNTFDYKNYLLKKGIENQVFLTSKEYIPIKDSSFSVKQQLFSFRIKIQNVLKQLKLNKDELDIMNALLLGQRQEISKALKNSYVKAGAIHILAISGLHIGIVLLILTKLFQPLDNVKNGTILKTVFIIITLWLFALFTGLSASVVRATTMFTFIAIGNIFQRKNYTELSLIISMLFILLINPMFLFDVGFQLSYLAVFSIICIQPLLYKVWKPKHKHVNKIWQLITVSIAAQIGILPISLYYFHQFPGLFLLSNIVIIPVLGAILLGGFVVILLAVLGIAPDFLVSIYSYCIQLMNTFIRWISLQEEFLITNISMSFVTMLSFYALIICLFQFAINKSFKRLVLALFTIILVQTVYIYEKQNRNATKELIVFHKTKNSIIGIRKGDVLSLYHNLDSVTLKKDKAIPSYLVGNNISKTTTCTYKSTYQFNQKKILCVDSLGVYDINGLQNPIILLQNNPKINLERLINKLKPQQIIVDGSNYKTNTNRWQETCIKQKTPFYDTRKNGACIIK